MAKHLPGADGDLVLGWRWNATEKKREAFIKEWHGGNLVAWSCELLAKVTDVFTPGHEFVDAAKIKWRIVEYYPEHGRYYVCERIVEGVSE